MSVNMYIYIRSINKLEHVHVYQINDVSVVVHFSHKTYEYCETLIKIYIDQHAKQYRYYITERLRWQIRCYVQVKF